MKMRGKVYMTPKTVRLSIVALITLLLLWPTVGSVLTQDVVKKPIHKDGLISALKELRKGDSQSELVNQVRQRGVDFELTPAIEKELQAAGASSEMIEAIRANYHPPMPRPTPSPKSSPASAPPRQSAPQIEMVLIPAGTFLMGSPDAVGWDHEHPQHRVTVQSFYMGKYEVTQAQYRAVMGTNPSHFAGCDECPVEEVSWNDAQEFIRKLNGMQSRYSYRLPSEAEWEYACRAGTTGDYAGDLDSMAWYDQNSDGKTHPVGQKQANRFGLYDMHGNVWEWCEDIWHENYNGAPTDGSTWMSVGDSSKRVLRGGSWADYPSNLRSAFRFDFMPVIRYLNFGFRLVAVART